MTLDISTTAFMGQLLAAGGKPLHEMTVEEGRGLGQVLKALYGPGPEMARVLEEEIPTSDGARLKCRILLPNEAPRALIVYLHGGGWVIGAIDEFDTLGRNLAERSGAAVALVDYRLAPEHPFPTPARDSYAAVQWLEENMPRLIGAQKPLIVMGDSAGGNLSTVVAQRAAREGGPKIDLQVLVYPVTDCDLDTPSYVHPMNQLLLSKMGMIWFWDKYVPNPADRVNPEASPLRAEDVSGMAPAVILTAEHDPLRDEGEAYVEKLRGAGVPVTFKRFDRQMHAFFQLINVLPGADDGLNWVVKQIDQHLNPRIERDALVVGAGFSGLYQLYRFRELGLSTTVVEAAPAVGGTWYANRYPGARCDVESLAYSYSFSKELEQEWAWTERYPRQPEILKYLNHVADRFDLRKDIELETRVVSAHYDEDSERWTVRTDTGQVYSVKYLVMATGCLSTPKTPDVPGLANFEGPIYHTANWPHEGVSFAGQRVGIIGTGSSGLQTIPEIAKEAKELHVFQRTATFSFPAQNRPLSPEEIAKYKADYRTHRQNMRTSPFGILPHPPPQEAALMVDPEVRRKKYDEAWDSGVLIAMMAAYNDVLVSKEANDTVADYVRQRIRQVVKDPATAEDLCSQNYPVGMKRPCLDTNYYETFNEPHVHLVNLRRTPIVDMSASSVKTADKDIELDALVLATGFDAMTGTLARIDIRGVGGKTLAQKWADGPITYLGITAAGFPNLFMVTGPSSPSVLSNMLVSIEQHVDWITGCVKHMRSQGLSTIEPTHEAEEEWRAHVERTGNMTLYPTADSWYMGANVPGKPRVFMAYIGGVGTYRMICDSIAATGYDGFKLATSKAPAATPA